MNCVPITDTDLRVYINDVWNPFVTRISGALRRPGIHATCITISVQYLSHLDPDDYPINDGDNVKLRQKINNEWKLIWQGVLMDNTNTWEGEQSTWQDTVVKKAYDYRAVLAKVPFRTGINSVHTWTIGGGTTEGEGTITFDEDVVVTDEVQKGFSIVFNAKQQFDEVIPDGAGNYTIVDDTDPDGKGKWFYINRTSAQLIEYIIRNAGYDLTNKTIADDSELSYIGSTVRFDNSCLLVGQISETEWFVPEAIDVSGGSSILEAMQKVLDEVDNWEMDINPSYYDPTLGEVETPTIVFFKTDDETNTFDCWWAGVDAVSDSTGNPYNITKRELSVNRMPIANRIIGILTGLGQIGSDSLSEKSFQSLDADGISPGSVSDSLTIQYDTKPDTTAISWHRIGRIAAAYIRVYDWQPISIILQSTDGSTINPKLQEYTDKGYDTYEDTTDTNGIIYRILVKPEERVEHLTLGPLKDARGEDGEVTTKYTHTVFTAFPLWRAVKCGDRIAYLKTNYGNPKFIYDVRTRKHRTDRVDTTDYESTDEQTVTPFGIVPDVKQYIYDTILPMGADGSIPVLGDKTDTAENYCTYTEIGLSPDIDYPWRTGGKVITDMDFIEVRASDLRMSTTGVLETDSQERWDVAKAQLKEKVQARFDEYAYAVTEGSITILQDKNLLRCYLDEGITTPLALRVNVSTGSPAGTHFERWSGMNARLLSIDLEDVQSVSLTLNDNPVIPGFTSRRKRSNQKYRVW